MKKRILSFVLALMMVVSVFVIPTSVSAASNSYTYDFEEKDARNAAEGQVFDVAAKGESVTAPVLDGSIGKLEYSVSGTMNRRSYAGPATNATIPVNFAVKDGYLYVAFSYEGDTTQRDIQFDIGVLQDHRTDGAWSRKQVTWYKDNTTGDQSWLMTNHGESSWLKWNTPLDSDYFIVDKAFANGVYEAKFDLKAYYKLFGISPRGNGIYDTPCVSVAIWYNVNNTVSDGALKDPESAGQTHYAFPTGNLTIDSKVTTTWVPATVIIPSKSLDIIKADKNSIGALGTDYLNVVEGQLLNNGRVYSSTLPTVDGTVNANEYSATKTYTGNTYTTDGNMTMSYSVGENGLVYVALQYQEAAHAKMLVQAGLSTNASPTQASRVGVQLNTNGTRGNQNSLWKDPMSTSGWLGSMWSGYSQHNARCDTSAATTHVDGLTTYEFTLSIPMMIESLEEAGWSADTANGIYFYFFLGSSSVQYKVPGRTVAQETALQQRYGFSYSVGYWSPTIALPADAIDRFEADNLDEIYELLKIDGQEHFDVAPRTAKLDGVIGAGEYTAVQEWDKNTVRVTDGAALGISYDISGKNYMSHDDTYLYIGAEVYDPNYVSGKSNLQLNLSIIDESQPIDIGYFVNRINMWATMKDSGATVNNYNCVKRSQTCNSSVKYEDDPATDADESTKAYVGQDEWYATFKDKAPEFSGKYDATSKTLTYEFAVKLADLKTIFGVDSVDQIFFYTYVEYIDANTSAKGTLMTGYRDTTERVADIVRNWTAKAHEGTVVYDANFFGHIINLVEEGAGYSYQFEAEDVRNAVVGQVFDVAAQGESTTAPTIDGSIANGEYAVSGAIGRNTYVGSVVPSDKLPVNFAVKDGYLYVAFQYPEETAQGDIQFDIGVLQDGRTDGAWSRKQVTWRKDNTTGDHSWLMKIPGTTDWAGYAGAMDSDVFLLEKAWSNGIYEAKFDLRQYYEVFGIGSRGRGIYETPCVSIAIWYNVDNTLGNWDGDDATEKTFKYPELPGQTHYAFNVGSLQINSAVKTAWIPATVIIPDASLKLIQQGKNDIGALGTDYLNAVEGQLLDNGRVYSDVLPTVDGTVNVGEYSASKEYTGNTYTTDGKMTMSYSVGEDGLVYVGLTYKEATHSRILVQSGLGINFGPLQASRAGFQINTNGSISNQNVLFKKVITNAWASDYWGGTDKHLSRQDVKAASTHVDGLTTYEFVMSLPMMIEALEQHGWAADTANGIWFYFFQGSGSVQYKVPGYASADETVLKTKYGCSYGAGYWSPTISLPADAIERFRISDVEDLENYFASGKLEDTLDVLEAAPSDVVLDGKIGAGEYTAVQTWDKTDVRAQDSQLVPGIAYDISGKNFVAYDTEYLYFGAEVYDPNYVSGKSQFQLNLNVIDKTAPIDIGVYNTTRMNFMATMSDAGVTTGNYGGVKRSQTCNASVFYEDDPATDADESTKKYVGQDEWLAGFNTKKPEAAGSYDATTKTITYEFKIKMADLEAAFGTTDIETINFMSLVVYTDKDTGTSGQYAWNFFADPTNRGMDILRNWTVKANGGKLVYDNNMYGHIINLSRDYATRQGASVRLSTEVSGLRFKTTYTDAYLADMQAYAESKGKTMEVGTLIAPNDYITDGKFTHADLGAGRFVEVMAVQADPFRHENGVTTFSGSLVNIKAKNLARDFAGIGFIKVGDEYFYSDVYAIRNVSAVAQAALDDTSAVQTDVYKNLVSEGVYSPYNEGQRLVLSNLVAAN